MSYPSINFSKVLRRFFQIPVLLILSLVMIACSEKTPENNTKIRIATAPGDYYDLFNDYIVPELIKAG